MKLLFLACLFICESVWALVGGAHITPNEAKRFSGILFLKTGDLDWCTATRFTQKHLLLAAHCVTERRNALKKENQDVRVRALFKDGQSISASAQIENRLPIDWELSLKILRTYVPVDYQYSSYDEQSGLRPETTFDVAIIEVENLPDSIGIIPIDDTESEEGTSGFWKVGFGCEEDDKLKLANCKAGAVGEIRRLKVAPTETSPFAELFKQQPDFPQGAKGRYHLTAGKENNGASSLSYYDSGGPLLKELPSGEFRIAGVNSKGIANPAIKEREAILFDLHTSLFAIIKSGWLKRVTERNALTAPTFEMEIDTKLLKETASGWEFLDSAKRPVWQRIRAYFATPEFRSKKGILKMDPNCRLVPKLISAGAPGLRPPRKEGESQSVALTRSAPGEYSYEWNEPQVGGYYRFVFEKPALDEKCRVSVEVFR